MGNAKFSCRLSAPKFSENDWVERSFGSHEFKKKSLCSRRGFFNDASHSFYFTFKKIITKVNRTRDSMKASPSSIAS
jgi:hypothetical protein